MKTLTCCILFFLLLSNAFIIFQLSKLQVSYQEKYKEDVTKCVNNAVETSKTNALIHEMLESGILPDGCFKNPSEINNK
jgi:hypothetical protein